MFHPQATRCLLLVLLAVAWSAAWAQKAKLDDDPDRVLWMRAPVPLGADEFMLRPANREFFLLGCVEDRRFDRLQISRVRTSPFVIDAAGDVWKNYPSELTFRISATALDSGLLKTDTDVVDEPGDLNSFLLGLRFRMKIFRGLHMRILQPAAVNMIGMPADIPYDERIYRVSFRTEDIPVDARLVVEVFSPKGQLLSRFHLELL